MAETKVEAKTSKPRKWLRRLLWVAGSLVVLLVVVYFVATSSAFFKGVILPKVSAALNAEVTVNSASISPFSSVTLRQVKVQAAKAEPLLTAEEVRLRYSLFDIIGGKINVDEVTVVSPIILYVQNADGTSNLDPLLAAQAKTPKTEPPPATKPSPPPQLNVKKLALNNATIRQVVKLKTGGQQVTELTGVNVTLDDLANAKTAKLSLGADLKFDQGLPGATNGVLAAKLAGTLGLALDASLMPDSVKGGIKLDVTQAQGAFKDAASLGSALDLDLTMKEIKTLAWRFLKGNQNLGSLSVSGPFDLLKQDGKLKLEIAGIDRQVLNIAGAMLGLDFNSTTINSSNQIELTQGTKTIALNGQFAVNKFSVTQNRQTTPTLDLALGYNLSVYELKKANVQALALVARQNNAELLRGALAKPMLVDWSTTNQAVDESVFELTLNELNLAEWKAFAAPLDPAGKISAKLNLLSQQAGRKLRIELNAKASDLAATVNSNRLEEADATMDLRTDIDSFRTVNLGGLAARLEWQKKPVLAFNCSGQVDAKTQEASLQTGSEIQFAPLAAWLNRPDLKISTGILTSTNLVTRKNLTPAQTNNLKFEQTVAGNLQLENFTAQVGSNKFDRLESVGDFALTMKDDLVEIKKLTAAFKQAGQMGGAMAATGTYDLGKTNGDFAFKLADLNQNLLRSFAGSVLASISINANATAHYQGPADGTLKSDLQITNLVVNDPAGKLSKTPLALGLQLDGSFAKQVLDLKQAQLALTPTDRATNQAQLLGRVDLTRSNAITGNLKLTADSLDLTPYYNLFLAQSATAGPTNATGKATNMTVQTTGTTNAPAPATNMAPISLPFQQFTVDARIGRLYVRELAISNLTAVAKLDGSKVNLDMPPFTINGATVTNRVVADLSMPGYTYDLALAADRIPVGPLADAFAQNEYAKAQGIIICNFHFKGAGTTPASVQTNLQGDFGFAFTNAEIKVLWPKWRTLMVPIAAALRLPEIVDSPINFLGMQGSMGGGKFNLAQLNVVTPAFIASTAGEIPLASDLNKSPIRDWPVNFDLRRSLAERAKLVRADTPTNALYAKLPAFIKVGGTVGEPKTKPDEKVILGMIATSVGNLDKLVGKDAGKALQNVGGFLTGDKSSSTNKVDAGQSTTNKPGKLNPLDLLNRFK